VPDLWDTPAFRAMNTLTTALWATCFALCLIGALVLPDPSRVWAPVGLMVATVAASRRLGRTYLAQRLATGQGST